MWEKKRRESKQECLCIPNTKRRPADPTMKPTGRLQMKEMRVWTPSPNPNNYQGSRFSVVLIPNSNSNSNSNCQHTQGMSPKPVMPILSLAKNKHHNTCHLHIHPLHPYAHNGHSESTHAIMAFRGWGARGRNRMGGHFCCLLGHWLVRDLLYPCLGLCPLGIGKPVLHKTSMHCSPSWLPSARHWQI